MVAYFSNGLVKNHQLVFGGTKVFFWILKQFVAKLVRLRGCGEDLMFGGFNLTLNTHCHLATMFFAVEKTRFFIGA